MADQSSKTILEDNIDHYFINIGSTDIAIQLKSTNKKPKQELIIDYKKMLAESVSDFNENEVEFLENNMATALDLCSSAFPKLETPEIQFIKTDGEAFGRGVFYTRQNNIVIPSGSMGDLGKETYQKTLIHEVFHIWSRYNPKKRFELYKAIGFEKLDSLVLSPFLEDRKLLNPDGVDFGHKIEIQTDSGKTIQAIPCLYSKYPNYNNNIKNFRQYMVFQLFEVQESTKGIWEVVNPGTGHSPKSVSGFREQIQNNTDYIIHPDEILADNFVLLVLSKNDNSALDRIDSPGRELLKKIEAIIKS